MVITRAIGAIAFLCLAAGAYGTDAAPAANRGVREIRMVPWMYQPSQSMKVSEQNPYPRQALKVLAGEWEKLHPGVRVNLMHMAQDQNAYIQWVMTQSKGETIPEIIFFWPNADLLSQSGWIIPIDEYYQRPNPYAPGNQRWRDQFFSRLIEPPFKMMDGHYYFVPVDIYLSALSYNTKIFQEAGVSRVPEDWAELFDAFDKIRAAGYEPFWGMAMWSDWPRALLAQYFHTDEEFKLLDTLPTDGTLMPQELIRGAKLGVLGVDTPRFREYMRVMKEWSRRWKKGFSLTKYPDPVDLFRLGKLGVTWQSATALAALAEDPYLEFQSRLMWFPPMTRETSSLARPVQPPLLSIPGSCYFLTTSAERNGLTELCIDWLMFLTAPGNIERLTQEETAIKVPPAVLGAKVDPVLQPLADIGYDAPNVVPIPWGAVGEPLDNFDRLFELYLMDEISLEECLEQMRYWEKRGIEYEIHKNQLLPNERDRWDLSKW